MKGMNFLEWMFIVLFTLNLLGVICQPWYIICLPLFGNVLGYIIISIIMVLSDLYQDEE